MITVSVLSKYREKLIGSEIIIASKYSQPYLPIPFPFFSHSYQPTYHHNSMDHQVSHHHLSFHHHPPHTAFLWGLLNSFWSPGLCLFLLFQFQSTNLLLHVQIHQVSHFVLESFCLSFVIVFKGCMNNFVYLFTEVSNCDATNIV